MSYNKAKSHDTGLNCLSVAATDSVAYQRYTTTSADDFEKQPQRYQKSLNSVGESEDSSMSSAALPEKTAVTSVNDAGDTTSNDDFSTFDLDLGTSLLDEILHALDKADS